MARYTGPKWKISRRENYSVFDDEKWKRRMSLPGVHPQSRTRPTEYAVQFREKQKVKRSYGMLEKQFRRYFEMAASSEGNTGLRLLQLLEMRLDNVVYRLGFAKTRQQARQMVNHGHIEVNGRKLDVPSYITKVGDEITIKKNVQERDFFKFIIQEKKDDTEHKVVKWLGKLDPYTGKVTAEPIRDQIDKGINEQLIIELYSK